jgi:hypothetical protein
MREFLRESLGHLLVPACVAAMWGYGHVRSVADGNLTGTWREGHAVRTGNPYTAPNPPITWRDPDDPAPLAVADLNAPDAARP